MDNKEKYHLAKQATSVPLKEIFNIEGMEESRDDTYSSAPWTEELFDHLSTRDTGLYPGHDDFEGQVSDLNSWLRRSQRDEMLASSLRGGAAGAISGGLGAGAGAGLGFGLGSLVHGDPEDEEGWEDMSEEERSQALMARDDARSPWGVGGAIIGGLAGLGVGKGPLTKAFGQKDLVDALKDRADEVYPARL